MANLNRRQDPAQVLVIDRQPLLRLALRQVMEAQRGLRLCAECDDLEGALDWLAAGRADIALLDPFVEQGAESLRRLRDACPGVRVVAFTPRDDPAGVIEAVRQGACAYVLRDAPAQTLLEALLAASRGECWLSGPLLAALFAHLAQQPEGALALPCVRPDPEVPITGREREVLACLAGGQSNKEIARALGISPNTVRNRLQRLQQRMGVHNRVQLALIARELVTPRGALDPPPV